MKTDIIPYDPYHPHLWYTLSITCIAWVSVGLYNRRYLVHRPHARMALYGFTIGLPIVAEALAYLLHLLRPTPDTPIGYVLTHFHAYVLQQFPIDSFISPSLGVLLLALLAFIVSISLARFVYGTILLNRSLAGARPIGCTRHARLVRELAAAAGMPAHAVPPVLVKQSKLPLALTTGLVSPRIYITTGLLDLLDDDEMLAVLGHEWAHVLRRDNLWNWLVRLMRDIGWFLPGTHLAWRQMVASQEEACDQMAARLTNRPLALARALVKVAQAMRGAEPSVPYIATPFALANAAPQARVEQMIRLSRGEAGPRRAALVGAYALGALLLILATLPVLLGS